MNITFRTSSLSLIFFLVIGTVQSQNKLDSETLKIQGVVNLFFQSLSDNDVEMMQVTLTDDVKILESGVIFNLDTMKAYLKKPRANDFKRVNTLIFFQTEIDHNMAFVSYHNQANIHSNNSDWIIKWLESAVLIHDGVTWRIQMLHSTRVERTKK